MGVFVAGLERDTHSPTYLLNIHPQDETWLVWTTDAQKERKERKKERKTGREVGR